MSEGKHILMLSGGKDSTGMLLMSHKQGIVYDEIICVDTTKEFPQMYEHLDKLEKYVGQSFTRIKIDFDYWFSDHIKTRGKNIGKRGYGWPDFRNRWCTALKRDSIKRYIKHTYKDTPVIEHHGVAVNEVDRFNRNNDGRRIIYPLVNSGITNKQALELCYENGFFWGGLYEKYNRVSCWCCPLSSIKELETMYHEEPDLWNLLEIMDKKSYRQFRPDYSVKDLTIKFKGKKS